MSGVAPVVAAITLACCACGGEAPTRVGFAAEANRVCQEASERAGRIDVPPLERSRHAARALDRVVATHREAVEELRDLDVPKADKAPLERWLAMLDQILDETELARDELHLGDVAAATAALERAHALGRRGEDLVHGRGVRACDLPGVTPGG